MTQQNQHKTIQNRRSKPILGVSIINHPDYNNPVRKTNSGLLQCRRRKKTEPITCMHRKIELTFHVMFIKGWNVVLLSKISPTLVGFLLFGFWDYKERETK